MVQNTLLLYMAIAPLSQCTSVKTSSSFLKHCWGLPECCLALLLCSLC